MHDCLEFAKAFLELLGNRDLYAGATQYSEQGIAVRVNGRPEFGAFVGASHQSPFTSMPFFSFSMKLRA